MGISSQRARELWSDPDYRARQSKSRELTWADQATRSRRLRGINRSRDKISAAVKAAWGRGAYLNAAWNREAYTGVAKPRPPQSVRVLPTMTNHQFHQYTSMRKAGVGRGEAAAAALLIDPDIRLPRGGMQAEKYRFIERLKIGQAGEIMLSDMSYETTRENVRKRVSQATRDRALRFGRRFSMRTLKDSIIITRTV